MPSGGWSSFRPVRDVRRPAADVEVDFGAGPRRLAPGTRVLDLTPAGGLVATSGPVDWSQLDKLPHCLTVTWEGADRGIGEAVAARPGIRFLHWRAAVGDVDLSGTRIGTVRVGGAGMDRIRLPESVTSIMLRGVSADLRVDAADDGRRVHLTVFPDGPPITVPAGLRRVPTVWYRADGVFPVAALETLVELRELRIGFGSPPGVITGLPGLRRHGRLYAVQLEDAYGLDPEALPDLPLLQRLEVNGTSRSVALRLRRRYRGSRTDVSVSRTLTQAWLAEHMDNPFRDWVHESPAVGRAACAAYTRAMRAISEAGPDGPAAATTVERALRGLVTDLNALDSEHDVIDTHLREHAGSVLVDLGTSLDIPQARLSAWFDEERQF